LPVERVFYCDLLERNLEEILVREGEIQLEVRPFQVLTLKLEPPI